jgi:hypothetical protein
LAKGTGYTLVGIKRTLYEKKKQCLAREMEPNGKVLFGRNKGGKPKGSLLLISYFL